MSRYSEAIDIQYRAKLDDLKREINQIPGITKKAARQITSEWVKGHKANEREARKAARDQERAAQRVADAWRDRVGDALDNVAPGLRDLVGLGDDAATALGDGGAARSAAQLAMGLGAVGAAAGAVGLAKLVYDAAQARGEILALSRATGVQAETLSGLRLAVQGTRLDFDEVGDAARDFGEMMFDLSEGGGRAEETFRDLGIQVRNDDRTFRDVNEVFVETIDKLAGIEDEARRVAYGQQLMGDTGAELAAVLGSVPLSEYIDLAREFGVDVGPDAARATAEWEASLANLSTSVQQVGNDLLEAIGVDTMAGLVNSFSLGLVYIQRSVSTFADETLGDVVEFGEAFADAMTAPFDKDARRRLALAVADLSDFTHEIELSGAVAEQAAIDFMKLQRARSAAAGATATRGAAPVASGQDIEAAQRVADEAAKIAEQAAQEQARAAESLQAVIAELQLDQLDGEERILEVHARRLAMIRELGEASGEYEAARLAGTLALAEQERDLEVYRAEAAEQEAARRARAFDDAVQVSRAAVELGQGIADMILTVSGANVTAQEDMTDQQKRAIMTAFRVNQAAAIVTAGINTAVGVTQALASSPPPASFVLAGLVGAAGAVETALIAAQRPPQFHTGGLIGGAGQAPDEVPIMARAGEGVVSSQGMAELGERGLEALNRGEFGGGPSVTVVQVGSATIEAVTGRALDRPSPRIRAALRRASGRPGHATRGKA